MLMKKHKNFLPKSVMNFVFVLDYNKYKNTKEKNLENKFKSFSKLGNIPNVTSEDNKIIADIAL